MPARVRSLFDLSVTTDRLIFGLALSVTSRYTMANLLLPLGLIAYGWSRLPNHFEVRRLRPAVIAGGCLCGALVLVQFAVSTDYGLRQAQQHQTEVTTANRIVVNFDRIPRAERDCYEFALVGDAGLVGDLAAIREARAERLTIFQMAGPIKSWVFPACAARSAGVTTLDQDGSLDRDECSGRLSWQQCS